MKHRYPIDFRGSFEARMAATSAHAFESRPPRSTPPNPPLDRARYPHLKLVTCTPYGTVTLSTCTTRWKRANRPNSPGQGAIDAAAMQMSSCRGCVTGAERCGEPVPKRYARALKPCACGEAISHGTRCAACVAQEHARVRDGRDGPRMARA